MISIERIRQELTEVEIQAGETQVFIGHEFRRKDLRVQVERGLQSVGFEAYFADKHLASGYMLDKVCKKIIVARAIIVDLSHANPNVYFELGVSIGLNKPVFIVLKNGTTVPPLLESFVKLSFSSYTGLKRDLADQMPHWLEDSIQHHLLFNNHCHFVNVLCPDRQRMTPKRTCLIIDEVALQDDSGSSHSGDADFQDELLQALDRFDFAPVSLDNVLHKDAYRLCDYCRRLRDSTYAIGHLTNRTSQNVYLLLGLATGLGLPTLLVSHKEIDSKGKPVSEIPSMLLGLDRLEYVHSVELAVSLGDELEEFLMLQRNTPAIEPKLAFYEPRRREGHDEVTRSVAASGNVAEHEQAFQLALQRYEEGDFRGVIELLTIDDTVAASQAGASARKEQFDERSEQLRKRAQAMIYYQEGLDNLKESPEDAELLFEVASNLDPSLANQISDKLGIVATRKADRALVQECRKNAKEFIERNNWHEAYSELEKAKEIDSPLKAVVVQEWVEARGQWRDQLLSELRRLAAESESTMKIVDQLHNNELLDSQEDQDFVDKVELSYYQARGQRSVQSEHWPEATLAWRAVLALEPEDAAAQESLRGALREQALARAHELYATSNNAEETLHLLKQHLEQPELQSDPLFLADLVRHSCQFGDFARAEYYLELLVQVTPEGSKLTETSRNLLQQTQSWSDAQSRSQSAIADGRYAAGVQALDDVIASYPGADSRAQWQRERNIVQENAVNVLLDKAREKKRQATGLGRIEVISLYSQVLQLVEPNRNAEAEAGIAEIQGELPSLVQLIVEEGERFNPEWRDSDDALRDVEWLLDQLDDLRVVTSLMGNQRTRWERLIEEVSTKLGNQRVMLRKVSRLMGQTRKALENPVSDQAIINAETWLRDAKREMSKSPGISDLEQRVRQARDEREQLKKAVGDLKDAARDVDDPRAFQTVLEAARRMRQIDPEDRYQLQAPQNLDVYDDFTDAHITSLEEYEQLALNRLENYRLYSQWEQRCIPQQETLEAAHYEVDDKRLRGALEEQQEALDRTIAVGQRALQIFRDRPLPEPASYLADYIRVQVSDWQNRAEAVSSDLLEEAEQVAQLRVRRDEWAERLSKVLSRPAVTANIAEATRCLDEMRKLDPNWPDLATQEQAVRVWGDSKRGGFFSRLRG